MNSDIAKFFNKITAIAPIVAANKARDIPNILFKVTDSLSVSHSLVKFNKPVQLSVKFGFGNKKDGCDINITPF